jgi:hypothetical protein
MVIPTRNQQTKLGRPAQISLALNLQGVAESVFSQSLIQFCSPIQKFNNLAFDNSMRIRGMEFFVPIAPVLVNAPKRDQVPASF